jgi:hypothetical protein
VDAVATAEVVLAGYMLQTAMRVTALAATIAILRIVFSSQEVVLLFFASATQHLRAAMRPIFRGRRRRAVP